MKKRILVVDDDNMNLVRTKMILGQEYEVLLAESGKEALEKLKVEAGNGKISSANTVDKFRSSQYNEQHRLRNVCYFKREEDSWAGI